nr:hypothetical protein [uncultured Porphyromonas sp.]
MKTIKLLVATAVMALCSVSAFAQTEAGKMMVGACLLYTSDAADE